MVFHSSFPIAQFHSHDAEMSDPVRLHECQLSPRDTSWPLQSIRYASPDVPGPTAIPTQFRHLWLFSTKQNRVDLLFSRQLEYGHRHVVHRWTDVITSHSRQTNGA